MHVALAVTARRRLRGLLGRPVAPLLLAPARSVHTVGMREAIDVVFLDADLRVLRVVTLPAGQARWAVGDRLRLGP
jgi:hypothetical protein